MWGIRWTRRVVALPASICGAVAAAFLIPVIPPPVGPAPIDHRHAALSAGLAASLAHDLSFGSQSASAPDDERDRGVAAFARGLLSGDESEADHDRSQWLTAGLPRRYGGAEMERPLSAQVARAQGLASQFTNLGYTLDSVREEGGLVPRHSLVRLPKELLGLDVPEIRKRVFLTLVLPLVLQENERILAQRARLTILRDRIADGGLLEPEEREWVRELCIQYRLADDDIDALRRRVDVIPPSLALAQAAVETGWGTSRVAQRGHALFGQMRPGRRPGQWLVRTFGDLPAAVAAYATNLNTHWAYRRFRDQRAEMRQHAQEPDGYRLALLIDLYSEKRFEYIRDVRTVIRHNRLDALDAARLDDRAALPLT